MVGTTRILSALKVLTALALMFIPLLGVSSKAMAQDTGLIDDETYVFDINGDEITWDRDWTFDEELNSAEPAIESIYLATDLGLLYTNYVIAESGDAEDVAAVFLESFAGDTYEQTTIDSGDTDLGGYSLDHFESDDQSQVIFSVFDDDDDVSRVYQFVSDEEGIGDLVALVQESLELNGDPMLEEFDIVDISGVELAGSASDDEDEPVDDEPADDETDEADATQEPEDEEPVDDEDADEPSGDNSYVMEYSGAEVAWEDPWEWDDSLNSVDDDFESVGFVGGTYITSILYMPTGVDLEESRDAFLEGFASGDIAIQQVDRGSYDNVSYSLDLTEVSGVLFGLFTVYIDTGEYVRSYATLAPESEIGDAVDEAAAGITIDGEPIYNGVTGSGLQDLIDVAAEDFTPTDTVDADQDPADDDEETPEADDEETPDADEDDNDTGGDADTTEYLETVRDDFDTLVESEDRLDELMGGGELSDADIDEISAIIELWGTAPSEASSLEAPDGMEDIQDAYQAYADAMGDASLNFLLSLSSESGSAERDDALDAYAEARGDADVAAEELEELLSDEGV